MFEKQCKSGIDKQKASASTLENPPAPSLDVVPVSPAKSEPGASQVDHGNTEYDPVNADSGLEETSRDLGVKQKAPVAEAPQNFEAETSSQPSKRLKTDE